MDSLASHLSRQCHKHKQEYLFAWAMELVSSGRVDYIRVSFMVAGHTKFAPDRLFSAIGSAYKAADVFTINDLNEICAQSATAHIENVGDVFTWRNYLGLKYSDLPGVRKLHDFLVVKTNTGEVVMKVREWCFSGQWKRSPL